jgi:hypothetical protein
VHTQRVIRDILMHQSHRKGTNFQALAQHLRGVFKKRSLTFVISDFLGVDFQSSMSAVAKKHEVLGVLVEDVLEQKLQKLGFLELEDLETGDCSSIDSGSTFAREFWRSSHHRVKEQRKKDLQKSAVELISVVSQEDYVQPLLHYFSQRKRMR